MLRLTFDGPTNEPPVAARDLLDVVEGSWGTLAQPSPFKREIPRTMVRE